MKAQIDFDKGTDCERSTQKNKEKMCADLKVIT